MTDDISATLEANSDQLNAADIHGIERIIKVRKVSVTKDKKQPVFIFFDGDNERPWKPSLGMRKVLAEGWGRTSAEWIGRSASIFCEDSVRYSGKAVGGIQIKSMTGIPEKGITCTLRINRTQTKPFHVAKLIECVNEYPVDKFKKNLPAMTNMMRDGALTLQQVIAQCNKTGTLSPEQLAMLEKEAPVVIDETETEQAAPIENNDNDEEEM